MVHVNGCQLEVESAPELVGQSKQKHGIHTARQGDAYAFMLERLSNQKILNDDI
jgi:hypothetical protein